MPGTPRGLWSRVKGYAIVDAWANMINKYEIIIYWSEIDNAYIAEVPELAGCMADGKTYADALHNAEVIIGEWIETAQSLGRAIPVPCGKKVYA